MCYLALKVENYAQIRSAFDLLDHLQKRFDTGRLSCGSGCASLAVLHGLLDFLADHAALFIPAVFRRVPVGMGLHTCGADTGTLHQACQHCAAETTAHITDSLQRDAAAVDAELDVIKIGIVADLHLDVEVVMVLVSGRTVADHLAFVVPTLQLSVAIVHVDGEGSYLAEGKQIRIDLYDELLPNTTYTIDFSDAIEDNNEGNPMGHYTYSFSTGAEIDTMEVAGIVLNAEDLEPIKGILVGLYPADSTFHDSLFTTTPFKRVSRTNSSGRFTIKGVKHGKYRIFALKDSDGDIVFSQKNEVIAFDTLVVSTSSKPDVRMDTIWRDSTHYDSIRVVPYTHYLPDDVILMAFLEEGQEQHLLKTERPDPDFFRLFFTAPSDTLPHIKGLNFNEECLVVEPSLHNDTLTYWVTDTTYSYQQDTLSMVLTYLETDTLGQLVSRSDTLELAPKVTQAQRNKEKQKQIDEWEKAREKKQKRAKEPIS